LNTRVSSLLRSELSLSFLSIEKLIELAKGDHTEYNKIVSFAPELFTEAASRGVLELLPRTVGDRKGGYTRITPLKYRDGDSALLVKLELIVEIRYYILFIRKKHYKKIHCNP
jgi:hypothetical protein